MNKGWQFFLLILMQITSLQKLVAASDKFDGELQYILDLRPFAFEKSIGEGSFGKVYSYQLANGSSVALKVMLLNDDSTKSGNLRDLQVALMQIEKDNESLIRIFAAAQSEGTIKIVMEYMPYNATVYSELVLEKLLKKNRARGEDLIRNVAYQGLKGLAFLHQQGLIHGDPNPNNMLLSLDGSQVKWCDFSNSLPKKYRPLDADQDVALHKHVIVDQRYRPPSNFFREYVRYEEGGDIKAKWAYKYNSSTDAWGLGCILGYMLFHSHLFQTVSHVPKSKDRYQDRLQKIRNIKAVLEGIDSYPPNGPSYEIISLMKDMFLMDRSSANDFDDLFQTHFSDWP